MTTERLPRVMLAAPKSGSGKTMITCGLLQALRDMGRSTAAFKCGPDYIDPMFHSRIVGIPGKNLDTFFTDGDTTRMLFARMARNVDISVIEGVMGYYDGAGMTSMQSSSYDLALTLEAPVILVVDAKGMGRSVLAMVKGYTEYQKDSRICGVIFNCMSKTLYEQIAPLVEQEMGIRPMGYVPVLKEAAIESRHLGLVLPEEIADLKARVQILADTLRQTVDLQGVLALAAEAVELSWQERQLEMWPVKKKIGIAKDEAFCFLYEDNLELLQALGGELHFFSPLHDKQIPKGMDLLLFPGGYPELYLRELSANEAMKQSIIMAVEQGTCYLAECGGYMYLTDSITDDKGYCCEGVGLISTNTFFAGHLVRFGYIMLQGNRGQMYLPGNGTLRGHEYHYYDTGDNGAAWHAVKPGGKRQWECMHVTKQGIAGFPHLYYYSAPDTVREMLWRLISARD